MDSESRIRALRSAFYAACYERDKALNEAARLREALTRLRDYGRDQDIMDKANGSLEEYECGFVYAVADSALSNTATPDLGETVVIAQPVTDRPCTTDADK